MKKVFPHIVLILLLLSIPIVSSPDFDGSFSVFNIPPFQREMIRFVLSILFFYLNLYVLLPYFLPQKKYFPLLLTSIVFFLLMIFASSLFINDNVNFGNFQPPNNATPPVGENPPPMNDVPQNQNTIFKNIFASLLPFSFAFLCSLFLFQSNTQRELEREKAKSDLLNLKYKLQPHFLFNILNSIYSLALIKSNDAPNGILKLSNVMRYIVSETDNDWVNLEKEITYLKDYIALQLIRTDDTLNFKYSEDGDFKHHRIAPMILVNFIENAFKYGFNAEDDSRISIDIKLINNILHFNVFNYIVTEPQEKEGTQIGLKNTLERLKFLYPNRHQIDIKDDGKKFEIQLILTLHTS